jgi:ubiquinone/menaquinone biosynthesis C-methylase UbiE
MSITDRVHFGMISIVHDTLYSLFLDPFDPLYTAGLKEGQIALEVGCGPGFFTIPAAEIVGPHGRIYAIDINPVAVEKVRQKVKRSGTANIHVIHADAAQTGLPPASFDFVFVFGFSHHADAMTDILPELERLLKPNGTLAVEGDLPVPGNRFRTVSRQGRITRFEKIDP